MNALENIKETLELAAKADHQDSIKDVAWMRKCAKQALEQFPMLKRLVAAAEKITDGHSPEKHWTARGYIQSHMEEFVSHMEEFVSHMEEFVLAYRALEGVKHG